MTDEISENDEDIIFVLPRPESGKHISIDLFTSDQFDMMLSQCYRTMVSDNICMYLTKKQVSFYLDGYFKKDDDVYLSLTINNNIQSNETIFNIQPLLKGIPDAIIQIFDTQKLEIIEISGEWISNIYENETEFIFNFTADEDIHIFKLFIEFELPYVDGIHSDIPIVGIIELKHNNIKYNITQYSSPYQKMEFYNTNNS